MKRVLPLALLLAVAAAAPKEDLAYGNSALRAWLRRIDADVPYLLVDRQRGQLRLMHGRALLRACPLLVDALGPRPAVDDSLHSRLRRARSLDPWSRPQPGPFDWEQNLVEEAPDDGALYFASGLLVYADSVWERAGAAPALVIATDDLRALYNACAPGTPLVVLPAGWQEAGR